MSHVIKWVRHVGAFLTPKCQILSSCVQTSLCQVTLVSNFINYSIMSWFTLTFLTSNTSIVHIRMVASLWQHWWCIMCVMWKIALVHHHGILKYFIHTLCSQHPGMYVQNQQYVPHFYIYTHKFFTFFWGGGSNVWQCYLM